MAIEIVNRQSKGDGVNRPTAILKIASRADADELIRDIRRAVRNSARTGGGYGIYRRHDNGAYAVAIEVNIKPETPDRSRERTPEKKGTLWNTLASC